MNGKTGKLLHKYATKTGQNIKELKRWWEGLSWKERTSERLRLLKELQGPEK